MKYYVQKSRVDLTKKCQLSKIQLTQSNQNLAQLNFYGFDDTNIIESLKKN